MKSYILDTNALLRFLLNDVPAQNKIVEKLLQSGKEGKVTLSIPQIVIFEINFTLATYYKYKKNEIINALESLISVPYLDIQSRNKFQSTLTLYKHASVSFVDCFLLVTAEDEGTELFTFDKKLKKISNL